MRAAVLASVFVCGCAASEDVATSDASLTEGRLFGTVERVVPRGDRCVSLVRPELRPRKVALVGACTFGAGEALSFVWSDTRPSAEADAVRTQLGVDASVHDLTGRARSEAAAVAARAAFDARPDRERFAMLETLQAVRVHSEHDFDASTRPLAQAAFDDVLAPGLCEDPGEPTLSAHVKDGFVYGYIARNSGSCHSGWFQNVHGYDRGFRVIGRYDYSE